MRGWWGNPWGFESPFVDRNKSFGGDLASQGLGDIKVRAGVRRIPFWSSVDLSGFVEAIFPTASPKDLGSGMYQVAPGVKWRKKYWAILKLKPVMMQRPTDVPLPVLRHGEREAAAEREL